MPNKKYLISFILAAILFVGISIYAAPVSNILRSVIPETDDTYYIGTTSPSNARYQAIYLGTGISTIPIASTTSISIGNLLNVSGTGTSTFGGSVNLPTGSCYQVNGSCVGGAGGGGGTPGGSDTQVQFNDSSSFGGDAGLTYNKTTDVLTLLYASSTSISVDDGLNIGGRIIQTNANSTSTFSGPIVIATTTQRAARLVIGDTSGGLDYGMLNIFSTTAGGGNYEIRLDSLNPDIEFVDTSYTTPGGKFEIDVGPSTTNGALRINSRNLADNSFTSLAYFTSLADNGRIGFFDATPEAAFEVTATSTDRQAIFGLTDSGGTDNILFNTWDDGYTAIGWNGASVAKFQLNSNAVSPSSIDLTNTIAVGNGTGGCNATNKFLGQFGWLSRDSSFSGPKLVAYIGGECTETYANDTSVGSDLVFYTGTKTATSPTEKMRLKDSGFLGIATVTPGSLLSVHSDGLFGGVVTGSTFISTSTTARSVFPIASTTSLSVANLITVAGAGTSTYTGGVSAGSLLSLGQILAPEGSEAAPAFSFNGTQDYGMYIYTPGIGFVVGGAGNTAMTIAQGADTPLIAIGNNRNPQTALDIKGAVQMTGNLNVMGGTFNFGTGSATSTLTSANGILTVPIASTTSLSVGNLLNVVGTGTSTFGGSVNLPTGSCYQVNGSCVGGAGGSANQTVTTDIPIDCTSSRSTADGTIAPGNAYYAAFESTTTNSWTPGGWWFGEATTSEVSCIVHIPQNMATTPNASLNFVTVATSSGGLYAMDIDAIATTSNSADTTYSNFDPKNNWFTNLMSTTSSAFPSTAKTKHRLNHSTFFYKPRVSRRRRGMASDSSVRS